MRYAKSGYVVDSAEAKGRELPEWFLSRPAPSPDIYVYLQGFWRLSTHRAVGMAVGPIPWKVAFDYAGLIGLGERGKIFFADVIQSVDSAYLEHTAKESKS